MCPHRKKFSSSPAMILIDTFQVNPHALPERARWIIADNYHWSEIYPWRRSAEVSLRDNLRLFPTREPAFKAGRGARWKVRRIVIIGNARSNVAEVARFDDQWTLIRFVAIGNLGRPIRSIYSTRDYYYEAWCYYKSWRCRRSSKWHRRDTVWKRWCD